jgi:glycosyltransferase involved in cell wall biosynthesis
MTAKSRRIAMISPFQLRMRRGVERFNWDLAAAFARRGVQVDLWVWGYPNAVEWGSLPAGVRMRRVPYIRWYMARWASLWYRRWQRDSYDHILLAFADYGEGAALRGYPGKFSVVFHFPFDQVPHRYASFQASGLAARAFRLIAPSRYVADGVQTAFSREALVIPHGVDFARFAPDLSVRAAVRAEFGVQPDAPILITLAALELRKGMQFVIRALPMLVAQFPDVQYWVLGEGRDRAAIEAEIAALGLGRHVRLFGAQDGVERFLNAADVSVLLAWGEAFGLTLIESMACGLPVVAADRSPFTDIVQPEYGALVDPDDPAAVAAVLARLLADSTLRAAYGKAGRAAVESRYNWDRTAALFLDALELS